MCELQTSIPDLINRLESSFQDVRRVSAEALGQLKATHTERQVAPIEKRSIPAKYWPFVII